MTGALLIGIGNADRGDDAAGLLVARLVGEAQLDCVDVIEHDGEPAGLIEAWRGYQAVELVDACAPIARLGKIHRFDARAAPLPERIGAMSSHGVGLATTIELARALGELPPCLLVTAIEGAHFSPGTSVSAEVDSAARHAAASLVARLPAMLRGSQA